MKYDSLSFDILNVICESPSKEDIELLEKVMIDDVDHNQWYTAEIMKPVFPDEHPSSSSYNKIKGIIYVKRENENSLIVFSGSKNRPAEKISKKVASERIKILKVLDDKKMSAEIQKQFDLAKNN